MRSSNGTGAVSKGLRVPGQRLAGQVEASDAPLSAYGKEACGHGTESDAYGYRAHFQGALQLESTRVGCEVDSRVKKSITGTFEYINFRPPPAHLAWGQSSTQVPFPDLSAVVEASRCLQRPKSDSLITVQLPEPSAERKARPRGATSNICLGLHRNSYERIKL